MRRKSIAARARRTPAPKFQKNKTSACAKAALGGAMDSRGRNCGQGVLLQGYLRQPRFRFVRLSSPAKVMGGSVDSRFYFRAIFANQGSDLSGYPRQRR